LVQFVEGFFFLVYTPHDSKRKTIFNWWSNLMKLNYEMNLCFRSNLRQIVFQ